MQFQACPRTMPLYIEAPILSSVYYVLKKRRDDRSMVENRKLTQSRRQRLTQIFNGPSYPLFEFYGSVFLYERSKPCSKIKSPQNPLKPYQTSNLLAHCGTISN